MEKENALLREEIVFLKQENKLLHQKLQLIMQKMFGKKSEKIDKSQLLFLLNGLDESSPPDEDPPPEGPKGPSRKSRERKKNKDRFPSDLPTEKIYIDPPEIKANPEAFKQIGEEVLVEYDYIPGSFKRKLIIRRKYVSKDNKLQAPLLAPAPLKLIEGSFASVSLLVHIILSKYVDHLPLYRQEQIFLRRFRVHLSRKTMCDWMWKVGGWLRLIYEEMKEEIRSTGYLQVDETPVPYLCPGNKKTKTGYLWVYHAPGSGVLYEWHPSRGAKCLKNMLDPFKGTVQSDAYRAYGSYGKEREDLIWMGCWAHVRRKFFDAKEDSAFAAWMLFQIQTLYAIEKVLRDKHQGPRGREALRQSQSRIIEERIEKAGRKKLGAFRPTSPTGKALNYTFELLPILRQFLVDGRLEIDNNLVENAIRPAALGRKNWMFIGSEDAGETSAILYSILETCKKLQINQQEYLTQVLEILPNITSREIKHWTPLAWKNKKSRNAA